MKVHDTVIIGGGPAGLTAGIYAMRARLNAVLIEKLQPGGQMIVTHLVENYPGFASGISGAELSAQMEAQARDLDLEIVSADVMSVDFTGPEKIVVTPDDGYKAPTVIIAAGATPRRLNVPGELELTGKGVSYCATCDGPLFRDKEIAVVGGGNTAVQDAVFLARFASRVTIVHRRDTLRATRILQERAFKNEKVEIAWNSVVTEIRGDQRVKALLLQDVNTGAQRETRVDGVFVLTGTDPNTQFLKRSVVLDPAGYVITDEDMQTNVPGVYAAGDCRRKSLRQMVTAAADGAIAAVSAERYLEALKDRAL